jgi:spore coat protein CotH
MTVIRRMHLWRLAAAFALCSWPGTAGAQTQEDVFTPTTVHEMRLTMSRRDWQALKDHFEFDTYYAADLRWNGLVLRNVGVRSRGHVTRNGVKPGLRIDVNRYLSEQRFAGLTAFSLDNAYDDPSLLREALAMMFFNRMGIPAPRETHTRLFVNEEYAGVYAIVESVDRTFVARAFGEEEAHLERGGYLFEYRWTRPYGFEYLGPDLEPYAEMFTPQTRETDSMAGLFGRIEELVRVINETPDDLFVSAVNGFLDLRLLMRYLAVENFLAETDGLLGHWGLHNFYLYRRRDDGRSYVVPTDKDSTFSSIDHPVDFHLLQNVLTRRAMAAPELRQIYVDTLMECAAIAQERQIDAPDAGGWLEREIEGRSERIRAAIGEDPVYPFSLDQFDSDVEWLRQFARQRPVAVACALGAVVNNALGAEGCTGFEAALKGE